jgi:UDP-GlcNAc:undecaprenyl-phosphate GlcNAc-1-phosphate transferase
LGLSPKKTVLVLYFISFLFGAVALLYSTLPIFLILTFTALGAFALLFFGLFLTEGNGKPAERKGRSAGPAETTSFNTIFKHKRRFVEVFLDFILICIAYYAAYFLRFEGQALPGHGELIRQSLLWIIIIKMSVFFAFGLYRGVWRYASISDLLTIFKVVTYGSVASVLFLTLIFRFKNYSRAVFFLDWLVLLFLISGSRVLFRILGEFFSRARQRSRNILIFGAGDAGEMVIREIKRNKSLDYNPLGFIDDDPAKHGSKIQGVEVLGGRDKIKELAREYTVEEIIIAIPSLGPDACLDIENLCRDCGISFRKIKGILD